MSTTPGYLAARSREATRMGQKSYQEPFFHQSCRGDGREGNFDAVVFQKFDEHFEKA